MNLSQIKKGVEIIRKVWSAVQVTATAIFAALNSILPPSQAHPRDSIVLAVAATMVAIIIAAQIARTRRRWLWRIPGEVLRRREMLLTTVGLVFCLIMMIVSMAAYASFQGAGAPVEEPSLAGDVVRLAALAGFYFSVGFILYYSVDWASHVGIAFLVLYSRKSPSDPPKSLE